MCIPTINTSHIPKSTARRSCPVLSGALVGMLLFSSPLFSVNLFGARSPAFAGPGWHYPFSDNGAYSWQLCRQSMREYSGGGLKFVVVVLMMLMLMLMRRLPAIQLMRRLLLLLRFPLLCM